MYDIGQGNNIKDKPCVFTIDFSDTIANTLYPCSQSPLLDFDTKVDEDEEDTKEDYIDTTQHTKAGEPSDFILLIVSIILASAAIWFLTIRKM
jgi:hypothetical protein